MDGNVSEKNDATIFTIDLSKDVTIRDRSLCYHRIRTALWAEWRHRNVSMSSTGRNIEHHFLCDFQAG